MNLPKKAAIAFFYRAVNNGINQRDIRNNSLRKYVDSTVHDGYYGIVYCRYLIIMSNGSDVGITLLMLPHRYNKLVDHINFNSSPNKNKKVRTKREKMHINIIDNLDDIDMNDDVNFL